MDYILTLPEIPEGCQLDPRKWVVHAIRQHDEGCRLEPCNCAWRTSFRVQPRYA